MKSLNPTQRACLEAMGIDVWVSRSPVADVIPEKTIPTERLPSEVVSTKVTAAATESAINDVTEQKQAINIPADWNGLKQAVAACTLCSLHQSRTNTVFGNGSEAADWFIIGDLPSVDDDQSGEPFSASAGNLLAAMLRAIGLSRQQVYVSNVLKCITPNNRKAKAEESDNCLNYLKQQIKLVKPKLILVVGQNAAQQLLDSHSTMARLRQKVHSIEDIDAPVIVTYHPASLLSIPADKAKAWQDLLFAKKTIGTESVL